MAPGAPLYLRSVATIPYSFDLFHPSYGNYWEVYHTKLDFERNDWLLNSAGVVSALSTDQPYRDSRAHRVGLPSRSITEGRSKRQPAPAQIEGLEDVIQENVSLIGLPAASANPAGYTG